MAVNPQDIENRNFGVIPLVGGLNISESKALVQPGTLQDTLNYEVVSRGYTRAQGLLHYNGTYDSAIENMWYIGGLDSQTILNGVGTFTLGGKVTWTDYTTGETGSGTCIYWYIDGANSTTQLGVVDVDGALPDTAVVFDDEENGSQFIISDTPLTLADAVYFHSGAKVCGTITDYLAFINSVNTTIASQTSSVWPYYQPNIPGTGSITGGFQFEDIIYAARDYMGIGFYEGDNKPDMEDIMTISAFTGKVAQVVIESGSWENGDATGVIFFEPHNGGSNDNVDFDAIAGNTLIVNTTKGSTDTTKVRLNLSRNSGQLWKSSLSGWEWQDLGYSLRFNTGTTSPNAKVAPLFLTGSPTVQDTGYKYVSAATETGDIVDYSVWNNLGNLYLDDAAVADSAISPGGKSLLIECNPTSYIDATDAEIIGIEVALEISQTTGTDCVINSLRLVNDATGAVQYQSDNVANNTAIDGAATVHTYGGQIDLWGMEAIELADLNSGAVKIQIQVSNPGGSLRTVEIDYVQIKVHYIAQGQTLYFWDGSSDVATADVYSFEVHQGSWAGNDAEGYMTFHNVSDPSAVTAGLTMYSRPLAAGDLIAVTAGDISRNLLPSEAELKTEDSQWEVIEANFWANNEGNAMYGATGASSAFLYDLNGKFAYIRPPISKNKDKPRHVAEHAKHLVLGLDSGHILVSAIDVPNDFDTQGTATTWSFRDPVTGLAPLAGNALGVLCRGSVNVFVGTAPANHTIQVPEPFRQQTVTPKSGAIEYTTADVYGPMYADFSGVGTIQTSDKYGDFGPERLTRAIEDWTRDRFQNWPSSELNDKGPIMGVPVRAKGQYRIYFEDGYILSIFVGDPTQAPQPMWSHLDPVNLSTTYVPTWMDSTILSKGRERIVMGDANGKVWIVDGANGIQTASGLATVKCHITTNPVNTGFPQGAHHTYSYTLMGDFMGAQNITTSVGYDYNDVSSPTRTKEVGDYDAAPIFDVAPDLTDVFVKSYTDGFSLSVQTDMDGSKPHTLHTIIQRYSRKGSGRNNTQVSR